MDTTSLSSNLRRRLLQVSVAALLMELGFDKAERMALETLVEMLQSLIVQTGISSRSYSELSGRTEQVVGDVVIALVNMGISLDGIQAYARRKDRRVLSQLVNQTQLKEPKGLQVGERQPHPPHIPDHLPPFPDPHTYMRTPTFLLPLSGYENLRETAATQKRDVELALTRFVARTSERQSLFLEDTLFPLVACKPHMPPYLKALLPSDQVFEVDDKSFVCQNHHHPSPSKKSSEQKEVGGNEGETDVTDNPYLRPAKLPRNI